MLINELLALIKMKSWRISSRKSGYICNPPKSSETYLQLSEISEAIKRNSHYAFGKLIDVGAGNLPYKKHFIGKVKEYITIDLADFKGHKPDIVGDALKLPLKNNSVDTYFSSQVMEHVNNPQKMVDEAYRVLKKDGICIVTTHMANPLHGEPEDYFRFTKYGLAHLFRKFSKIEKIEENGGSLLSAMQFIIWGLNEKLPRIISKPVNILLNPIIKNLDKKFHDSRFTTNYIIVARK
jgi:SAM-dependent methyltransferase